MLNESLAFGDSPVHRIDSRLRVAFIILFSFLVAFSEKFTESLIALGFSLILILLAKIGFKTIVKRLLIVNGFIFFLWVVLPLSPSQSPVAFALGPLKFYMDGVLLAGLITIKSNAIILGAMAMISTMSMAKLGHSLNRMGFPTKLVYLLLFTYRYIFVIEQEYLQLRRAARMRSFSPAMNFHTYRTYSYLVGMLLARSFDRGKRVHQAMVCRGFSGKFYCLDNLEFRKADYFWAAFFCTFSVLLGVLPWMTITLF